jgi:two-component system, LytTR family, sensor kinase
MLSGMNNIKVMKKHFFEGNIIKILLHILAWAIIVGLPLYFIKRWQVGKDFIWLYYINTLISGIIFYINYLILVPKLFFEKKRYKYYLSVLVLIACFYFVSDFTNKLIFRYESGTSQSGKINQPPDDRTRMLPPGAGTKLVRPGPPFREMHLFNYGFTSLFLIFFSLGLRVLERNAQIEELQKETEKEKLNSELAFLKNQISPHFFFNTLNNIYSLISINPEDSQKAVLKLSKLMRYLLYESEQGQTMLNNEIDFMNNYIDLMKLRMSDKISLSVSFPQKYEDRNIPPLLFVPFIENAFKHGISYREKSFIDIRMEVQGDSIIFRCVNSIPGRKEDIKNGHSGIGLENASKRLNLLFPGSHSLKVSKSGKEFEILLNIKLR